jgi:hypothetical protein
MSKLSSALGANYEQKRRDFLTRKFELGGHTFKVRIPLVSESDVIYKRITEPNEARVDELYKQMAEPLMQYKDVAGEEFEFKDGDILVQGKSLREAAKIKAQTETRIVEYIKLLVPEMEGASLENLTYEDVESEWPLSVQLTLCEKIGEVISPGYKETRGN